MELGLCHRLSCSPRQREQCEAKYKGGLEIDRSTMDSYGHTNIIRSHGARVDLRLFAADIV